MSDVDQVVPLAEARGVEASSRSWWARRSRRDPPGSRATLLGYLVPMSDGTVTLERHGSGPVRGLREVPRPRGRRAGAREGDAGRRPDVAGENRPMKALVAATQGLLDQLRAQGEDGGEPPGPGRRGLPRGSRLRPHRPVLGARPLPFRHTVRAAVAAADRSQPHPHGLRPRRAPAGDLQRRAGRTVARPARRRRHGGARPASSPPTSTGGCSCPSPSRRSTRPAPPTAERR